MIGALLLLGCWRGGPSVAESRPLQAELSGRISLSWDADLRRGRLVIASYLPAEVPLPAERSGVPLGRCRSVVPRPVLDGVLSSAEVSASCEGEALALDQRATGLYAYRFEAPLAPGAVCQVTIADRDYTLPPLPEVPDVTLHGGRARWTPGGGDELRLTMPRRNEESTICRLEDDGRARVPRPRGIAFVSRHRYALPAAEQGRVSITVTAGRWWDREAAP